MTNFMLHGGYLLSKESENQSSFFTRFAQHCANHNSRCLACFFASPHKQEEKMEKFSQGLWAINPEIEIELASISKFTEQLASHDVIYLDGGKPHALQPCFCDESIRLLKSKKVISGESSGAMVLMQHYILESGEVCPGLGILPYSLLVHADTWPPGLQDKLRAKTSYPLIRLNEKQFIEIEMDINQ